MENHKARSVKSTALYWIAFTAALALVAVAVMHLGGLGPRPDSTAPGVPQSVPVATSVPAAPATASQAPVGPTYTISGLFLFGNSIGGETNFSPSEIVADIPGNCKVTPEGEKAKSLTLFQDLGPQTVPSLNLWKSYITGSTITLSNPTLVGGDSPHIVADARITPPAATGPFPAYLEEKKATFRWALPAESDTAGRSEGDRLISCYNA